MRKIRRFRLTFRHVIAVSFVMIVAIFGVLALINSRAATDKFVSLQPENWTVASPAIGGDDTTASAGKYVQFKNPSSSACSSTNKSACAANKGVGMYTTSSNSLLDREAWLGAKLKYGVVFPGIASGGAVSGGIRDVLVTRELSSYASRVDYVFSFAPIFVSGGATSFNARTEAGKLKVREALQKTVDGDNDAGFKQIAQTLKDEDQGDAIIRLGWEMTGPWFSWSAIDNCSQFRGAWQRVHSQMKSVAPNLRFDFTFAASANYEIAESCAYPGNEYVDIIGMDFYDRGAGSKYFDPDKPGWIDPALVWKDFQKPKLDYLKDLAIRKGKPISMAEWGLEGTSATGGIEGSSNPGGDNPYFVQALYDWYNSLPTTGGGKLLYHAYFWHDSDNEGPHTLDDPSLKNAGLLYKKLYGP